jgi:hypothetical protein
MKVPVFGFSYDGGPSADETECVPPPRAHSIQEARAEERGIIALPLQEQSSKFGLKSEMNPKLLLAHFARRSRKEERALGEEPFLAGTGARQT